MKDEPDVDPELSAWLAEEPELQDDGFTARVLVQLRRRRRIRRTILAAAGVAGTLLSLLALAGSPLPLLPPDAARPDTLAAALLLAGLCGGVWIATEARTRA